VGALEKKGEVKMTIKEEIEKIKEGKNDFFIGTNRNGIRSEQGTDSLTVFEDKEMVELVTYNTDYTIFKENINIYYSDDDTVTIEFNKNEKVVIRAL
jgi:hypothetical protein